MRCSIAAKRDYEDFLISAPKERARFNIDY